MLLAAFLTILKRENWDPGEGDSSAFPRMISISVALSEQEWFSSGNTASVHRELESAAKVLEDTAKEEDLNDLWIHVPSVPSFKVKHDTENYLGVIIHKKPICGFYFVKSDSKYHMLQKPGGFCHLLSILATTGCMWAWVRPVPCWSWNVFSYKS